MHTRAKQQAGFDQFMRVVAVRAADDNHHAAFLCQLNGRVLPLLRRLADGINETYFRPRKAFANQPYKMTNLFNGLGGLGHDAETRPLAKSGHALLVQHHVEFVQIPVRPRTSTCSRLPMMTG